MQRSVEYLNCPSLLKCLADMVRQREQPESHEMNMEDSPRVTVQRYFAIFAGLQLKRCHKPIKARARN